MNPAVVQTLWAQAIVRALADAGVRVCVLSPGSRSTPLALALAAEPRIDVVPIIDERAAAFYALGVARATGEPAAIACTSGTAAAHYLPAIVEASLANVPLVAVTADRPPELHACGANQTIAQVGMYAGFPRAAFDLGAPEPTMAAFRAVVRKVAQAIAAARGPRPGPVHVEVPLRKPLEPRCPANDAERAFAGDVAAIATPLAPAAALAADPASLDALADAIAGEPSGVIAVGAMPVGFAGARDAAFALARRTGYPILGEAGSQLRFGPRPDGVTFVDHLEVLLAGDRVPAPNLVVQLGAEPLAAGWTRLPGARWVIASEWRDPDASARAMIVGDPAATLAALAARVATRAPTPRAAHAAAWATADSRAATALAAATAAHPRSEIAIIRAILAALPPNAQLQLGNSLPIRVVEHCPGGGAARAAITQRGASGIDGLVASAAGAAHAGTPTALILGDVSFAHDLGGLVAARRTRAPLAIVVIDNAGGRIFDSLPIAGADAGDAYARCFLTPPELDVAAVAAAIGARAAVARDAGEAVRAVADALERRTVTVIHAPVAPTGARDVVTTAIAALQGEP